MRFLQHFARKLDSSGEDKKISQFQPYIALILDIIMQESTFLFTWIKYMGSRINLLDN